MPKQWSIQHPELFLFSSGGQTCHGASQSWFAGKWKQQAGCGPTVCASLLMYLAKTRPECAPLWPRSAATREDFLPLMEEVWGYVTPGNMGVNSTKMFTEGAARYAAERGVDLAFDTLAVPPLAAPGRPSDAELAAFLQAAFTADLPVAFLNLSNGALQNLDSWHWVTLTGAAHSGTLTVTMLDDCTEQPVDLSLWLHTTALGGGVAVLRSR